VLLGGPVVLAGFPVVLKTEGGRTALLNESALRTRLLNYASCLYENECCRQ
jgi:hypothetical protein